MDFFDSSEDIPEHSLYTHSCYAHREILLSASKLQMYQDYAQHFRSTTLKCFDACPRSPTTSPTAGSLDFEWDTPFGDTAPEVRECLFW